MVLCQEGRIGLQGTVFLTAETGSFTGQYAGHPLWMDVQDPELWHFQDSLERFLGN